MVLLRKPQPNLCLLNLLALLIRKSGMSFHFWYIGYKCFSVFCFCCLFLGLSPGSDAQVNAENVRSREQILQTLTDLSRSFQDIADRCLLVLHLEVRQVPPFLNLRGLQTQILRYLHTYSDLNVADLQTESTQLQTISISAKQLVFLGLPKSLPGPKDHQWVIHSLYPPTQALPPTPPIIL